MSPEAQAFRIGSCRAGYHGGSGGRRRAADRTAEAAADDEAAESRWPGRVFITTSARCRKPHPCQIVPVGVLPEPLLPRSRDQQASRRCGRGAWETAGVTALKL